MRKAQKPYQPEIARCKILWIFGEFKILKQSFKNPSNENNRNFYCRYFYLNAHKL